MKKLIVGLMAGIMIGSAATAFAAEDIDKEVKALLGSFNFKVNGVEKKLDKTPLVYEGTAYLSVREVAKLTGYEVDYTEETRTIDLNSNPPSSPPSADAAQKKPEPASEEQAKGNSQENMRVPKAGEANWVYASYLEKAFISNKISFGLGPVNNEEFFVSFSLSERLGMFKLEHSSDLLDITPLIRAGIVKLEAGKITDVGLDKAAKIEDRPEAKVGNGNWVEFFDLMNTLDRKKIKSYGGGGGRTTTYTINGTEYKLQQSQSGDDTILFDITPLIEAKIVTLDEVKNKPVPQTNHLPKVKAGEGNWILYSDLQDAIRRKFARAGGSGGGGGNVIPEFISVGIDRKEFKLKTGLNEKGELMVDMTPLIEAGKLSLFEVAGRK
ncbi:hypothetical protein DVH26_20640 [Paenibacillus sp. H1-7]|uniref:stalk domain-containing protein n=1 Tax=Paenibacillus sp. H1-7 TaxID=2282849 RepID=UPI001EF85C86|nr:stalk domain-containing protein [Paenibacillus sp. H1-7]ULL16635.1 hypothetical protein DVH26_20640 [Paenibacillus sp. H1-7]